MVLQQYPPGFINTEKVTCYADFLRLDLEK